MRKVSFDPDRGEERQYFVDNPLVRIHFIIEMISWTGLAPWDFEFSFSGSLTSTLLKSQRKLSRTDSCE